MYRTIALFALTLGFCLSLPAAATNVVWVSFHPADNQASSGAAGTGFTTATDKGYTDLLEANGFTVTRYLQTGTPDATVLNAADLVIVSRSANSASFQDAAATRWNQITAPMMILGGYVIRQNRMGFSTGNTIPDTTGDIMLTVKDPQHPIFRGIPLTNGTMTNPYAGVTNHPTTNALMRGISIVTEAANANGKVLATVSAGSTTGPAGAMVIAEWPAGVTVTHAGGAGTDVLGGPRLVFLTGSRETNGVSSETAGYFDLKPDGAKMFINAVRYMTGDTGGTAANPIPADKAVDVPSDTTLGWTAGQFAQTHDVYLGLSATDVNNATRTNPLNLLVSQGQSDSSFATAGLQFGQTYYWRVDEVNAPPSSAVTKGNLWSFTVEPYAYPIPGKSITATASSAQPNAGPENTINGSGLDAGDLHGTDSTTMWMSASAAPSWIQYQFDKVYKLNDLKVWNSNGTMESFIGFGAKDVKIEYSTDGATWTVLANVPPFARAPGAPGYAANTTVDLGGVMAQYVKLTITSNWGGVSPVVSLSEVRFSYVPVQARAPQPAAAATGQSITTTLNWRPGRDITAQKVYFGTDPNAVANGMAAAKTVATHAFDPGALNFGTTYYWKVEEIGATTTYPGDVWSFTTQEYAVVDNFETYDQDANRLYDAWIDGATDGKSNSFVGNNPTQAQLNAGATFAETAIVHGGKQSMPMTYDNTTTPFYSEATRTFDTTQDWTTHGADTLSVWFRGRGAAFLDNGDGTYTMSSSGTDIWNASDQFRFAYKSLSGDGSMVIRVDSVANTNVWAKAGVMIRQSIDPTSTNVFMQIDPGGASAGNGASWQYRLTAGATSASTGNTGAVVAPPYWVKVTRTGNSFSGYIAPDGKTWTQIGAAQTITMNNPVLIGLAVCSHDATKTTVAQFSNLSQTGNITGSWQVAAIGMAMPTNEAAPLYLTVQDKAGKSKTVVNPNPAASVSTSWTEWRIPLSSLTGVNLTTINQLVLGVGDKTSPKAGGAGIMYFDDIGYGHPVK